MISSLSAITFMHPVYGQKSGYELIKCGANFSNYKHSITFALYTKGPVAEWLGRALQKLPHQFDSGRDLLQNQTGKTMKPYRSFCFSFYEVFAACWRSSLPVAYCQLFFAVELCGRYSPADYRR